MDKITPVFLGADLNCYTFARAFHEAYGVKSYAFGRYPISATKYSRIVKFTSVPDMDTDERMLQVLTDFAANHKGERLYLFGCTDDYAEMIIRLHEKLPDFTAPCPSADLYGLIQKKAEFYEELDKRGLPYPDTVVLAGETDASELSSDKLGFDYPIVVKPSSSVVYWKHPFDGMRKVYFAKDAEEASAIVAKIYASGYDDRMILQRLIPGGDSKMRVLTVFSDENAKVRGVCLGHTMIEEHTPKGLGNHAAIVTEPVSSMSIISDICRMLEELHYTGFSNFDIKEDMDGSFKIFEINLRQGRSNMYVTSCGMNIARLAVEKYNDGGNDVYLNENVHLWHHPPLSCVYTYTEDGELVSRARTLAKSGRVTCSLKYKPDLRFNIMRRLCVFEQLRRQKKKFRIYYPVKRGE